VVLPLRLEGLVVKGQTATASTEQPTKARERRHRFERNEGECHRR